MPQYIHVDEQKALFDNAKTGDMITFNPRKAYPDGDAEIAALLKIDKEKAKTLEADFSYQVTEISRFNKAEVNQEMFDAVFGKDNVKSEDDFRKKIADNIQQQLQVNSDYKFFADVRKHLEDKVGTLTYPDSILKRVMLRSNEDKGAEYVEKNYDESIKQLTWHLIKEQLVAQNNIKIEDEDVKREAKEAARMQFARYGMNNVPDQYLDNYVKEMLEKREQINTLVDSAIDHKLTEALKNVVTLTKKTVSLDKFNEMMK